MLTAKPRDMQFSDKDHEMQLSRLGTPKSTVLKSPQPQDRPQLMQAQEVQIQTLRKNQSLKRSVTDSFCCYMFMITQFTAVLICIFGMIQGNPNKLAKPYDPDHRACGVDVGVEAYPFIFFATPQQGFLYRTVCVSQCPNQSTLVLDCAKNSLITSCNVNPSVNDLTHAVLVYDTFVCKIKYNSICLPSTQYYFEQLNTHLFPGGFQQAASDSHNSKYFILVGVIVSLFISGIYLFLAERYTAILVWSFITLFIVLNLIGGLITLTIYNDLSNPPQLPTSDTAQINDQELQSSTKAQYSFKLVFLILSITLTCISLISFILVLCFCRRIKLAIMIVKVIKVATDFVQSNFLVNIVPVVCFFITLVYFTISFIGNLFLYSSCPVSALPNQLPFDQVQVPIWMSVLVGFNIFGVFWFAAFIIGCGDFVISGGVADWYYRQGQERTQNDVQPIMEAFQRLRKFHFGSVALGALLIALTSFFKFLLEYLFVINHQLSTIKKNIEKLSRQNDCTKCLVKCCICCLFCFEVCLHSISKYAYVMINLTGQNFFSSAQEVVKLVSKDPETFSLVGGLGEVLMMLGRLFISSLAALICYQIALHQGYVMAYVPALIVSFTISTTFVAVHGMSAEAIFLVYIHSQEFLDEDDVPQSTQSFQIFLRQAQQI